MNYETIPSKEVIEKTANALRGRGIEVFIVDDKESALLKVKELIPQGVSVMNGSSTTLEQIGFVEYLESGQHGWNNLHEAILAEKDQAKQMQLRMQSSFAEYFLGSVHAITEEGQTLTASASGSQIAPYAFTARNIIWVASSNKIVPSIEEGIQRIRKYSFPLEDTRMKNVGYPGSSMNKVLILEREPAMMGRRVILILVNEKLGF
ncbi:MAG: lactate utilization protein [Candidatus Sungbacteria bacterium]|nr:lactate utilization protein [Candidatus Sungbacteria bacterium]